MPLIRFVSLGKSFKSWSLCVPTGQTEKIKSTWREGWENPTVKTGRAAFNTYKFVHSSLPPSPDNNLSWLIWACELFRIKYGVELDSKDFRISVAGDPSPARTLEKSEQLMHRVVVFLVWQTPPPGDFCWEALAFRTSFLHRGNLSSAQSWSSTPLLERLTDPGEHRTVLTQAAGLISQREEAGTYDSALARSRLCLREWKVLHVPGCAHVEDFIVANRDPISGRWTRARRKQVPLCLCKRWMGQGGKALTSICNSELWERPLWTQRHCGFWLRPAPKKMHRLP